MQRTLIDDLIAQGYREADANELIALFLIGERRPDEKAIRNRSLAASPEASRLLCLPERRELHKDWTTVSLLAKRRKLIESTLYRRINVLRDSLVADMTSVGIDHEVAGHLVENHLIGTRVSDVTGYPLLAVSAQGELIAEAAGLFEQRRPGRPPGSGRQGR